jgi:hypothetical protein
MPLLPTTLSTNSEPNSLYSLREEKPREECRVAISSRMLTNATVLYSMLSEGLSRTPTKVKTLLETCLS